MTTTAPDAADIAAIHTALATYVIAIDSRDLALVNQCFAADGVIEIAFMGSFTPAEYAAMATESLAAFDATHHHLSLPALRVEGDRAFARTYFTAQHTKSALAPHPHFILGGWYDDRLERRDGRWLIVHKQGTTVWADGNPEVMGGAFPPGAAPRGPSHEAPGWLRQG